MVCREQVGGDLEGTRKMKLSQLKGVKPDSLGRIFLTG